MRWSRPRDLKHLHILWEGYQQAKQLMLSGDFSPPEMGVCIAYEIVRNNAFDDMT